MTAKQEKLDIPFIWANKPNQYDFALTKARENDVLYYACRMMIDHTLKNI